MMRLPRFHYHAPATIAEAARMLADLGPEAKVVAGGTDLFPNMKRRQQTPLHVIGLRGVKELRARTGEPVKGMTLGAMTSLSFVEHADVLKKVWPALAHAAATVSTPPLRNMGTIGGNLCLDTRCNYYDQNYEWRRSIDFCMKKDGETCWVAPGSERCWAVSSSDTAPVLCAAGAEVSLVSKAGERRIPVADLFHDDGIEYLAKKPEEILTAVHLPANDGRTRAVYRKVRRRGSFDFPVCGVGVSITFAKDGKTVERAGIVIGGVGSRPRVAKDASDALVGKTLDADTIAETAKVASQIARPLDNTDFEMSWRRTMAREELTRALGELAKA